MGTTFVFSFPFSNRCENDRLLTQKESLVYETTFPPMDWRQKLAKNVFRWSDRVLYVDRSVIVMNKPPGLITQLDPTTTV
jgi:23S rRNA-/tRNA-specific pseudouridylate synthase